MRPLLKAKKGVKMSRKRIEEIKNRRFRRIVRYVYQNCPFYRRKFKSAGIDIDTIKSVEDISKLPFTTKQELREAYPLKILCVPKEKIVRIQNKKCIFKCP